MKVPFNSLQRANQELQSELHEAMIRVANKGVYLRGEETYLFEKEWAEYCGQKYCVCCANGTDAITLAALGIDLRYAEIPANTVWYTESGLLRANCMTLPMFQS